MEIWASEKVICKIKPVSKNAKDPTSLCPNTSNSVSVQYESATKPTTKDTKGRSVLSVYSRMCCSFVGVYEDS